MAVRLPAKHGQKPSKQAEVHTRESLEEAAVVLSAVVSGGPVRSGPFFITGTWWFLRVIGASLLRMSQVEVQDEGRLVIISLSDTKTDLEGRGFKRAHRCLYDSAPEWFKVCPARGVVRQVSKRTRNGAGEEVSFFPNSEGGFASKSAVARTLKRLLEPDGPGEFDGHSLKRCGEQTLIAAGVEPWLVEWFGRWGSAAIRAYTEDASARAQNVSQQALRVVKPEAGTAGGCSGRAPPTPSMLQVASLGTDKCAGARSEEEVQVVFGMGLSSQTGDVPIDSGAADNKGEASMVRRVLSHAGMRRVVEGTVAEQFAGCDEIVRCVSDASKGATSSSGSSGSQEDAAEDCLSAQEGRERRHVVVAASSSTVSGCASRPAPKRMRLRTASVRRRGRERRHIVIVASPSTVSGCGCQAGTRVVAAEDCLSAQGEARATARRSRRVVLHGFGVQAAEPTAQEDAAEDCLSAQEGGVSDCTL